MTATRDARFWDGIARRYAGAKIRDEAGWERTLARTAALLAPTDTVLELGCGTGGSAIRIAPRVARLVATDVSAAMIAIARERAQAAEGRAPVFLQAAADDPIEAPEGGFDAVLAYNLLHLVPDRAATLARVRDLLRPGGLFVTKTPCLTEMPRVVRLLVPAMRAVGMAPASVAFFDARTLEADIEAAGFAIVERDRHGSKAKDPRVFLVARKPARYRL